MEEYSQSSFLPPVFELKISCSNCKQRNSFSKCLSEKIIVKGVFTGIITCPDCGLITYSYLISDKTKNLLKIYTAKVRVFQKSQTVYNFNSAKKAKRIYQESFDEDQSVYSYLLEKVSAEDDRRK